MNSKEAKKIVGGLSRPSKMPGYAYNLPAKRCKVGSKLVKIKGSVCHGCYALKGRYVFPSVQDALERRYQSIFDARWVFAMAHLINGRQSKVFRWHDSGDIQSLDHLKKIFQVCELTPGYKHWLPTREASILSKIKPQDVPDNLIIRLSASKVDGPAPKSWPWTSTVVTKEKTCPAAEQNNECKDCRVCWDKSVKNVAYGKH